MTNATDDGATDARGGLTNMTTTAAYEELQEGSTVRAIRAYVERVAFTQRGRFAFIAALLVSVTNRTSIMLTEGVASANPSGPVDPGMGALMGIVLGTAATIILAISGGMAVLLILDLYEDEIGTVYDGAERTSMTEE